MTVLNGKKIFGAGRQFAIPHVANPTPIRFGVPQDMSVTFKRAVKELYGEGQLPVDVASGELSCTFKLTFGTSNARLFSDLIFGASTSVGQVLEADNEVGTPLGTGAPPGTAPFKIVPVNSASTPLVDLGVTDVATGVRMVCVATGAEVVGVSYSINVSTGNYEFAAGDVNKSKKISYTYTITTSGETLLLANSPMGRIGGFTGVFVYPWTDPTGLVQQDVLTLNSCVASDTELMGKGGDYGKPTASGTAGCDLNGTLGTLAFAQAA